MTCAIHYRLPSWNLWRVWFWIALPLMTSCASGPKSTAPAPSVSTEDKAHQEVSDLQAAVVKLNQRLELQDEKLAGLNDRLAAAQAALEHKKEVEPVKADAVATAGKRVSLKGGDSETDVFENSEATDGFRKSYLAFEAAKYSDAILQFSAFLKEHADHPMAGSAQFLIGEAYFKQKEYKLALSEYQRVLLSYDRSAHVSDAFKRIAECNDKLGIRLESGKNRELLISMFPQSPAAASARERNSGDSTSADESSSLNHADSIPPVTAPMVEEVKEEKL